MAIETCQDKMRGYRHGTPAAGHPVAYLGDPLHKIFRERPRGNIGVPTDWEALTRRAHAYEQLDHPHRWTSGSQDLRRWILAARDVLKAGGTIDLHGPLLSSVTLVFAENQSRRHFDYQLDSSDRRAIAAFERSQSSLLVLTL